MIDCLHTMYAAYDTNQHFVLSAIRPVYLQPRWSNIFEDHVLTEHLINTLPQKANKLTVANSAVMHQIKVRKV